MRLFRLFLSGLARYRAPFLGAAMALVFVDLLDLTPPLLIKLTIDRLQGAAAPELLWAPEWIREPLRRVYLGEVSTVLFGLGAAFVGVVLLQGVGRFAFRIWFFRTANEVARDLRGRLFAHVQSLDAAFFARTPTGDLMSRATNDIEAVRLFYGIGMLLTVDVLMYFATVPWLMLWISPWLTLWVCLPLPLLPFFLYRMGKRIHHRFEALQEQLAGLSAKVQENFAGIRVVKAYAQEESQVREFGSLNDRYLTDNLALARLQSAFDPVMHLGSGAGALIVLLVGGAEVISGRLSLGWFVAFNYLLLRLVWPLMAVGWVVSLYQRGMAGLKRVHEILDTAPAVSDAPATRLPERPEGRLEIRGLTVAHPANSRPALREVSLDLAPGRLVVLLGPVGAGKSTLLHAIPRVIDPPAGSVFLDGVDVREWPLAELRKAIGMVPQDPFLFSESIAENLRLGAPEATTEALAAAASAAQVRSEIEGFPGRFETLLGERGVNLSGGQKQRVTLARAILKDPRILLLDDCFSSVDADTEAAILSELRNLRRGRTTLLVTHRLAVLRQADWVVFLDDGRVVEQGTPASLMAANGPTARYAELQSLREALETA